MVIWLIGMSASGKTTIGKKFYNKLKQTNEKWVFLDGDVFRNILGEDLGHSFDEREKNGYRISRFCEYLNTNEINVIASVLSISHKNQNYNRKNINNYREVYIDVRIENLIKRDNKKLYLKAKKGKIKNVVGVDIEFKPPISPDYIINNNKDNLDFDYEIDKIIKHFNLTIDYSYVYTKNNLLENPIKYEYSLFEGKVFFKNYTKDRNQTIKILKERLKNFPTQSLINYKGKSEKDFLVQNKLVTKLFLNHLMSLTNEKLYKQKNILKNLIKKFEVSKKLFSEYDKTSFKNLTIICDDIMNYSLFSIILQKLYNYSSIKEEKLIFLNTSLKINDLLSSIKTNINNYNDIETSIKSIEGELKITRNYND